MRRRLLSWHNASRWRQCRERQSNEVPTVCTVFSVPLAMYLLFGSVTTCSQKWCYHLLYATFNVFTFIFFNYTHYHVACVFVSPCPSLCKFLTFCIMVLWLLHVLKSTTPINGVCYIYMDILPFLLVSYAKFWNSSKHKSNRLAHNVATPER
jgi:phosphatidylserine synthase